MDCIANVLSRLFSVCPLWILMGVPPTPCKLIAHSHVDHVLRYSATSFQL